LVLDVTLAPLKDIPTPCVVLAVHSSAFEGHSGSLVGFGGHAGAFEGNSGSLVGFGCHSGAFEGHFDALGGL
jgi:hypothetical protein